MVSCAMYSKEGRYVVAPNIPGTLLDAGYERFGAHAT